MLQLCETLKGDSETVIERWTHLTHGAPWSELSTEQLIDHLPALLYAIIDAALCDENEPARRRVISEAYRHGVHRRQNAFDGESMLKEYRLLRAAIWERTQARADHTRATKGILRIDRAISAATVAGMIGFHCQDSSDEVGADVMTALLARWG